jgi:hypothetical protein
VDIMGQRKDKIYIFICDSYAEQLPGQDVLAEH